MWIYDWYIYSTFLPENKYIELDPDEEWTNEEAFMLNVMWLIDQDSYRFDFLLAGVDLFIWIKCLLMFRITNAFGPMFKIMYKMVVDLIKFLIIWTIVLLAFSCVSLLVFG